MKNESFSFEAMIFLILTISFLLVYAGLIFFYNKWWEKLPGFTPTQPADVLVSVIIAARNEEKKISFLIQDILNQTYPQHLFEIIVVDDFSTDKTSEILKQFEKVSVLMPSADAHNSSKKKAIDTGVRAAKGELIIITDADCRIGKNWIHTIAAFYKKKQAAFIAAPVKYCYKNSTVQKFQAVDFLMLQGITAAGISANFHNMCNGANLAYSRQAFLDVNGFENIDHVATGDDMLLMHKIWKLHPKKVFYLKSDEAIVSTDPMHTWKDFFMQRRRWASKTFVYEDKKIIAVLAFVYLFNCWFFILLVASFFNSQILWIAFTFLVFKFLIELFFMRSVTIFYKEKNLLPYLLLFQPLHIFYTVFVGLISQFGKYEWKGRRTR